MLEDPVFWESTALVRHYIRFALGILSWLILVACFLAPAKAAGPLSVRSSNPRFFVDSNGKAVYLSGVHLNNDLD